MMREGLLSIVRKGQEAQVKAIADLPIGVERGK